ncbi:MAG: hypothetical protein AAF192_18875 [Pseudomonadota bacterium]
MTAQAVAVLGLFAELMGYALIGLVVWAGLRARGRSAATPAMGDALPQDEVGARVQSGLAALAAAGIAMVLAASAVGLWRVLAG